MTNKEKLQEFIDALKTGRCPFCGQKLEYYDGALGYEALKCTPCGLTSDYNGFHLEGLKNENK